MNRPSGSRRATHVRLSRKSPARDGSTLVTVIFVLAVVTLVAGFVIWRYLASSSGSAGAAPILTTVSTGPFESVVIEQGEVESSNNVEIKCEVKSNGTAGTVILWVIEEGAMVEEGDLLVRLDSSALADQMNQQRIICNSSLALKIQAENVYQAAEIARVEYIEGAFEQERQTIQSEIFIAEENLRRAKQYAQYSERLAAKGYVTALQLEGDRFAVEKAQNELDLATRKLHVLEEYTQKKTLKTLEADIATAKAKWEAEEESYSLEMRKLEDLKTQIAKCEIFAPRAGQVVHANEYSSRGNSEFVVEPGASLREGQTIIRIPDPTSMQVKSSVNEAKVTSVDVGMPVAIRVDALNDTVLEGVVTQVNEYAEPTSFFSSSVKKYGTLIKIKNPPPALRPGLTAQVRIFVERRPDVLQVPVQAIYASGSKAFVLVKQGDLYETREIEIGSSNDAVAMINSGLSSGDLVVMNPRSHVDKFKIPEAAAEPQLEALAGYDTTNRQPVARRIRPQADGAPAPPGGAGVPGEGPPRRGPPPGGAIAAMNPAELVTQRFATLDADGDGLIAASEMPTEEKERLTRADTDGDGSITRAEMLAAIQAFQARMREGGGLGAQ